MLLRVKNLSTHYESDGLVNKVVNNISFSIPEEKIVCLVGESGCGKTITTLSILKLIDKPGKIVSGRIIFEGKDISNNSFDIKKIRGNKISMIFQEAMTSLNPSYTIGYQIDEILKLHKSHLNKKQRYEKVLEVLEMVKIPFPNEKYNEYPYNLSGGQSQRVMIAMAMVCEPTLLIADEPTTALDVTIQADILQLMINLKEDRVTSILFITHDLAVASQIADEVLVMYKGNIVEKAKTKDLFENPKHPYTKTLLKSLHSYDSIPSSNQFKSIDNSVNYLDFPKETR
jgi:dipeptide transport system ATP-binding protein